MPTPTTSNPTNAPVTSCATPFTTWARYHRPQSFGPAPHSAQPTGTWGTAGTQTQNPTQHHQKPLHGQGAWSRMQTPQPSTHAPQPEAPNAPEQHRDTNPTKQAVTEATKLQRIREAVSARALSIGLASTLGVLAGLAVAGVLAPTAALGIGVAALVSVGGLKGLEFLKQNWARVLAAGAVAAVVAATLGVVLPTGFGAAAMVPAFVAGWGFWKLAEKIGTDRAIMVALIAYLLATSGHARQAK